MIDKEFEDTLFKVKNNSVAHPIMKQQYTYNDLKAAYEYGGTFGSNIEFERWWKNYKFEMTKENGTG